MFIFKHKNFSWKKIITSQLVLIIIIVIFFTLSFSLAKTYFKEHKVNLEIASLENEIQKLEKENLDITGLLAYLQSDEFVEKEARLNMGLKRPGEELIVIKENKTTSSNDDVALRDENLTNPKKWWRYFIVVN